MDIEKPTSEEQSHLPGPEQAREASDAPDESGGGGDQLPLEAGASDRTEGKPPPRRRAGAKRSRRKRQGSSPSRQQEDTGADLERRVGRVEFADGALVRLRVPIRADADPGRDVLTDIDVLSMDVDLRLRITRSILECKTGRRQAGEPDRLFWLAGFQEYLGVERAVLVRLSASRRGLAVARRLGLHLLDAATLSAREVAHGWVPERFAHVHGDECLGAERRADTQLGALGEMPGTLVSFLRHDALLVESHQILGGLVALEGAVRSTGVLPDPAGVILAGHALTALLIAAITDAARAETLPNADLRRRLELATTTGNPDDEQVLEVLGQADELLRHHVEKLHRAYTETGSQRVPIEMPSLRDLVAQPPRWLERYIDLVERLRANPSIARDLLQTAELACFDALVGGNAWKAPAFDHLFTPEHRNLLLIAVRMLGEIAGEAIGERLGDLGSMPFDRVAPSLPDRSRAASPDTSKSARAPLAQGEKTKPRDEDSDDEGS